MTTTTGDLRSAFTSPPSRSPRSLPCTWPLRSRCRRWLCSSPATTPAAIARGLLVWADSLTQGTAEARRVRQGESAHLSVTGLLPDGALILVYGGLRASAPGLGADLGPDPSTTIPLAVLRHTATLREVTA